MEKGSHSYSAVRRGGILECVKQCAAAIKLYSQSANLLVRFLRVTEAIGLARHGCAFNHQPFIEQGVCYNPLKKAR